MTGVPSVSPAKAADGAPPAPRPEPELLPPEKNAQALFDATEASEDGPMSEWRRFRDGGGAVEEERVSLSENR